MFKKNIVNNVIKLGISTWLKSTCNEIKIDTINLILNNKLFGKVDELYLEATNLIYQNLYINKIIIQIYNFNLKFNYKNHLIYSEDLIINSSITIKNNDLENIFFSSKWKNIRTKIQIALTEGENISKLVIKKGLIFFNYKINKLNRNTIVSLNLKDNLIFLENINNKKRIVLPLDKNIIFNNCQINGELINIDLLSKVVFDN